ncbi:NAD+ synthase [Candidatus Hydrogenedentota bacterium]
MANLRLLLAQVNPTVGDFAGNREMIVGGIAKGREGQADVVVFPELAICGYPPEDLLLRSRFVSDCCDCLKSIAPECSDITAIVGCVDRLDGRVFNSAAILSGGEITAIYHKTELPNYGVFDEKRYFAPGEKSLILDMGEAHLAVTICEDIWVEGSCAERGASSGSVSVTVNISASPFNAGKFDERREVLVGFARRCDTYVCYTNVVGGQDELVFDGGSMVVDPKGRVVASARRFQEDFLVVDLPLGDEEDSKKSNLESGICERAVISVDKKHSREAVSPRCEPRLDSVEEIYKALVLGTRDYALKNGFQKVALGLSGGIDSTLTAVIAVDALGIENVVGVTMPSRYTSDGTLSDAERLAKNLGIEFLTLPIETVFEGYMKTLDEVFAEGEPGIEAENLQARIRGNLLMALSNRFGWLVLTTGNKSETAVGYCTLYGDMAGGFAVIKDVPKTLVYDLSRYYNARSGTEIIPESVIERAPSAELRPEQKDEDSLPPYEVLDPLLKEYVEEDKSHGESIGSELPEDVVRDVMRLVDLNEYKRRQAPPGVKITPKAFGKDRRLPITNRYRGGSSWNA